MPNDFHRQFNFRVDVNTVIDTLSEGKLAGELHGVSSEDEALAYVARERFTHVFKHRRDHLVVDLVGSEVELHAVAVAPNLDVSAGHTGEHRVERVVKVLHLEFGLDVLSVHTDNAPLNANGDVEDEVGLERIDEGRVVHGEHGGPDVTVVDDFDVGAVGPCRLVSWEVPHGHVVTGFVEVDLEEVNVSPTVVIAGLENEVVGVACIHRLVPRTVPLHLVGVKETVTL